MRALLAAISLLTVADAGAQQARLAARSVLPAQTWRDGSPPAGAFLAEGDRTIAQANGIRTPLPAQPVQGFSSMIPADATTWWALSDNGFGWRPNSGDYQLALYRVDPRWGDKHGPRIVQSIVLRDPDRRISWQIVCDRTRGAALPEFSVNRMPPVPQACGSDPAARILTGFDVDPESIVRGPDGTFWIGDEYGPSLLHFAADGRLLDPPYSVPGVRSPQNASLRIGDTPTLAASRGFEGVAITPDGATIYGLLEGAAADDDPRDLRIYAFDVEKRAFRQTFHRVRLEMPGQKVDLTAITGQSGMPMFPGSVAPKPGPVSIGELKAVNDHQFLMIERDNLGDGTAAPRFKKIFLLDIAAPTEDGRVAKTLLLDLLCIPDPDGIGGDGDFFSLPFYTIESVHVTDAWTLLVASDNNFPFSNGRSRSRSNARTGPLAADDTEMILVRLGSKLDADPRLFPTATNGPQAATPPSRPSASSR